MADPGSGLYHRNAGVVTDIVYKRTASSRDDEVHQTDRPEKFCCSFTVSWKKGADCGVDFMSPERPVNDGHNGTAALIRIRATLEHADISATET